jgi:nucleoside-diphosphate-sugar epimerase
MLIATRMTGHRRGVLLLALKVFLAIIESSRRVVVVDGLSVVTGANGYLGQWVCHSLLSSSSVSATAATRSGEGDDEDEPCLLLVRPERVAAMKQYWEKKYDHAKVVPYDMLDGGDSLRRAIAPYVKKNDSTNRTTVVYHTASVFGPTDDHVATARANVQGTTDLVNVLAELFGSCGSNSTTNHHHPCCRLVVTSSMAAVRGSGQKPANGRFYTRDDWNTESQLGGVGGVKNWGNSYQWSKMESERIAWQLCDQYKIPMTALCPSFLFGPAWCSAVADGDGGEAMSSLSSSSSYSLSLVREWIMGQSPVQSRLLVDVRDAAYAHVQAGRLNDVTIGHRYIVSSERRVPSTDIAKWLLAAIAQHDNNDDDDGTVDQQPIQCDTTFQGGVIVIGEQEVEAIDLLRNELGVALRPLQETIADMAAGLLMSTKI